MNTEADKQIIMGLARQIKAVAQSDEQYSVRKRFRDTNDLQITRPPLLLDEIPWHELNAAGELTLQCENPFARFMEDYFRKLLYRHNHFKADVIVEDVFPIQKAYINTGYGIQAKDDVLVKDAKNNINSHSYTDVLYDEEQLAKMKAPVITPQPQVDEERLCLADFLLGGVMTPVLRGHDIYYAPWDVIARYRPVEAIYEDLYDNPEFLHKIIAKYTECSEEMYAQMEKYGLLEANNPYIHCTPASISGVPSAEHETNAPFRMKDVWFRSMAQAFGSVSPKMHREFDINYSLPMMKKCAYVYYGCCEPLDNKLDILFDIPNLRKIGCSPWANAEKMAERMGSRYVLARKPNPASVAVRTSPEGVRAEIADTVKAAQRYGCPVEFVLKDISTVSYRPENLEIWCNTASAVLDEYYGK